MGSPSRPSNGIILSQPPGTDCGSKNDSCGPFVASNLVPPSGMACTTSVLSVVAAPQLNGTNISCYSNEILQYQHVISITSKLNNPYYSLIHSCAFSAIDIGVLVCFVMHVLIRCQLQFTYRGFEKFVQ